MINLLWKIHQDSCQFFAGCEKLEDSEPFPCSTLQVTVNALVYDIQINKTLTCPLVEFLGLVMPTLKHDKWDPGSTRKPVGSLGKQHTKNPSIPPICTPVVKELNSLYP
jgi:hypothetical protein